MSLGQRNLFQQGFQSFTRCELSNLTMGLRFTPFLCMVLGTLGIITHNIYLLSSVAALGFIAAFFPDQHPFDLFYNHVVRHIFKAEKLPSNPLQRRLACLGAGFMNGSIALLFLFDPTAQQIPLSEVTLSISHLGSKAQLAYILGGILIFMQVIVFTNHFCALSWAYEKLITLMGGAETKPITPEHVSRLMRMGATIVDVRNEEDYAESHIEGAINIPLETLNDPEVQSKLGEDIVLTYCYNGKLSHIAQELLRKKGRALSYNLGSLERANSVLAL
ncbi:rhodanese-like domain-containing protein [sulfur-oxidizing endosymbiont of Gigantopelta aegis]|uniref:rhodanese-like domain-containing protein n=1 Tax=sulfur-oxidizing endosymbiont of Gigantopelta aegis TaxID=2794934 RepID=UPI0018DCE899|nr:rhodanese-like domain-containing protein [sulfur-oxidizing endosymbiont of Gigantopelta aegis]